jgi:hypothetical protein
MGRFLHRDEFLKHEGDRMPESSSTAIDCQDKLQERARGLSSRHSFATRMTSVPSIPHDLHLTISQ